MVTLRLNFVLNYNGGRLLLCGRVSNPGGKDLEFDSQLMQHFPFVAFSGPIVAITVVAISIKTLPVAEINIGTLVPILFLIFSREEQL